jgi:hypothetical protein
MDQTRSLFAGSPPADVFDPNSRLVDAFKLAAALSRSSPGTLPLHHSLENLCGILEQVPSIPDSFAKEHDIVEFLLDFAAQCDNVGNQTFAIFGLSHLLAKCDFAISRAISHNSISFVHKLLSHPDDDIQFCAFWIIASLHRTSAGCRICFRNNIFGFLVETFADRLYEPHVIVPISKAFLNISGHASWIQQTSVSARILSCYFTGLWQPAMRRRLVEDSVVFATQVVKQLGDVGIELIVQSHFLLGIASVLKERNVPSLHLVVDLVLTLCQTKRRSLYEQVLSFLDCRFFRKMLLEPGSDYVLWEKLCQTVACLRGDYRWICEEETVRRMLVIFENGVFPEKLATSQLVFLVMSTASVDDVRAVFDSGLAINIIPVIESSPPVELKRGLKAVANGLQMINRFGMANYDRFNEFQDELVIVLKEILNHSDHQVVELAEAILKQNYPEVYYALD